MSIQLGDAQLNITGDAAPLAKTFKDINKKIGLGLVAVGAVVTGALAGLVKSYTAAGDEVQKMALKTGFSTEKLSELKFAAELGGASLETIAKGSKNLARVIFEAGEESKIAGEKADKLSEKYGENSEEVKAAREVTGTYGDALKALNLTTTDLMKLTPEDRFMEVAFALADVEDAGTRAALAQELFGRAGVDLLPMLAEGRDGLKAMAQEARDLGVVFDQEAADASAEFNDNILRLTTGLKGLGFTIIAELIPVMNEWLPKIKDAIVNAIAWVKENGELIATIVKAAAVLGPLAIALGSLILIMPGIIATMGLLTGGLGAAGLGGAAVGATGAIAGGGGLIATLGALLGPIALVVAALVIVVPLVWELHKSILATAEANELLEASEESLAAKVEEVNEQIGASAETAEEARIALNERNKIASEARIELVRQELSAELGRAATLEEAWAEEIRRDEARADVASAVADVVVFSAKREAAASTKATDKKASNAQKEVTAMQARMGAITKGSEVFAGAAKAEEVAFSRLSRSKIESSEKEIAMGRVRIGELVINGKKFIATISEERQAQIDAEHVKVQSIKRELQAAQVAAFKKQQFAQKTSQVIGQTASEIAKANEKTAATVEQVWDKSSKGVQKAILDLAGVAEEGTNSIGKSFKDLAPEVQAATNKVVDSMMKTSPFSKNSPSLVDQTQGGLNQMADMWSGFADGLSTLIAGLVEKMAQLSPFSKQSPSLVDQVKSGTKEMAKQWASYTKFLESISGESMPMPTGLGASLAGVAGTVGGAATSSASLAGTAAALNVGGGGNSVSLTIDMSGATVRSDADIEIISQRLFRHVDRTLRRAGIQTGFATS